MPLSIWPCQPEPHTRWLGTVLCTRFHWNYSNSPFPSLSTCHACSFLQKQQKRPLLSPAPCSFFTSPSPTGSAMWHGMLPPSKSVRTSGSLYDHHLLSCWDTYLSNKTYMKHWKHKVLLLSCKVGVMTLFPRKQNASHSFPWVISLPHLQWSKKGKAELPATTKALQGPSIFKTPSYLLKIILNLVLKAT